MHGTDIVYKNLLCKDMLIVKLSKMYDAAVYFLPYLVTFILRDGSAPSPYHIHDLLKYLFVISVPILCMVCISSTYTD